MLTCKRYLKLSLSLQKINLNVNVILDQRDSAKLFNIMYVAIFVVEMMCLKRRESSGVKKCLVHGEEVGNKL